MDNHIMYFCDEHGELELTRCCLCELMYFDSGEMECQRGYDCMREECANRVPVEKKKITKRFEEIRENRRNAALNFHMSNLNVKTDRREKAWKRNG